MADASSSPRLVPDWQTETEDAVERAPGGDATTGRGPPTGNQDAARIRRRNSLENALMIDRGQELMSANHARSSTQPNRRHNQIYKY